MLRMPAPTSLNAFTPSTPWAVTTPRYSATGRPSIPGVVVTSISVPPCLVASLRGSRPKPGRRGRRNTGRPPLGQVDDPAWRYHPLDAVFLCAHPGGESGPDG